MDYTEKKSLLLSLDSFNTVFSHVKIRKCSPKKLIKNSEKILKVL